jgi:hypothetical protein
LPVPPGEVLKTARAAAMSGDYAAALASYEDFFDHSLQDQGGENNYYGVRLSFCLDEWARLAEKYPKALQRLEAKAKETIAELERTRRPALFHDFISINKHLGQERTSIDLFLKYHSSERFLAEAIVNYIWDRLVEDAQWAICAAYLTDPFARYKRALEKFDMSMKICTDDPSRGGSDFAKQIRGKYIRDVTNLCLVLKNIYKTVALAQIVNAMESDTKLRMQPALAEAIRARIVQSNY